MWEGTNGGGETESLVNEADEFLQRSVKASHISDWQELFWKSLQHFSTVAIALGPFRSRISTSRKACDNGDT